jgi:hypothetical protein
MNANQDVRIWTEGLGQIEILANPRAVVPMQAIMAGLRQYPALLNGRSGVAACADLRVRWWSVEPGIFDAKPESASPRGMNDERRT